ncbi:hypothetical protein GCM10010259_37950 [Streptomyces daghestanicus]|uniref:Secreted protein n=3 Tax=Streptomyces TaxID=1883 RepID=A0A918L8U5_STRGD|nr:hypothetical protein GCM10010238_04810 [Streptomyces niveoruber]GGU43538.1 hypothetical protein GCM10010259_37950 [Streptomyces daghestanicus]GHI34386.1 hypothetical protein Sdagh_61160 [Streptomyces daghestanicus]
MPDGCRARTVVGPGMTKKLLCASLLAATALVTAAPAAQAAPAPGPAGPVPVAPLLDGLLGSLEIGNPATSPQSLLPAGLLGGARG